MSRPDDLLVFGRRVYRDQVETAVIDHLKLWFPTYLRWIERDRDYAPGFLQDPQSWQVTYLLDHWPEQALPGIVVTSPGQTGPMTKAGDGRYNATWAMRAYIVLTGGDTGGDDEPVSGTPAKLAGLYAAAIGTILAHNPALPDIGGRCVQISEGYDDTPSQMRRSMSVAHLPFLVQVQDVMHARKGPDQPYPNPDDPPPALRTYLTDDIDVTSVPLTEAP
jgi:hypothetical protein